MGIIKWNQPPTRVKEGRRGKEEAGEKQEPNKRSSTEVESLGEG